MRIELKKFGKILTSRPAGKEAFAAIRAGLDPAQSIEIDFDGVISLSPSWADEFFSALSDVVGKNMIFLPSDNPSVVATLHVLRESQESVTKAAS